MTRAIFSLAFSIAAALVVLVADAAVVEKTFIVGNLTTSLMCQPIFIIAVNGQLPGPTLDVFSDDDLIIHVVNQSPYNLTIHWHGVNQRGTPWADGPEMITQCPIMPGRNYTYNFKVAGQEGTLLWHAHVSFLCATVYGPIIIRPKSLNYGYALPYHFELEPIIIGEWWNANVEEVDTQAYLTGLPQRVSDAFTINGLPGDLHPCSKGTYKIKVVPNKVYLLRIINAALSTHHFFKIAGHNLTVVAIEGGYTAPYTTDVVVIASGQTVDVLLRTDAHDVPGNYYVAAKPYSSTIGILPFDNTTATAILIYQSTAAGDAPVMPAMPDFNDSRTVFTFWASLTSLLLPESPTVPKTVDEKMFITVNLGPGACQPDQTFCNQTRGTLAASMNNVSFVAPKAMSMLEAHYKNLSSGVYTADSPDNPPAAFNYTDFSINFNPMMFSMLFPEKGTKAKRLAYNTSVQIVLQNTAILGPDFHPMHLHGYDFWVIAQGFGNFKEAQAQSRYNLVNPQSRNTIMVPALGWAVIRFFANNPVADALPHGAARVTWVDDDLPGGRWTHSRFEDPITLSRLFLRARGAGADDAASY